MTTEQEGAPSATAGGAPAPNPNAVDNSIAYALTHHYGFLPLSVRFSAAAAARAVAECWTRSRPVPDAEILPADRKPVHGSLPDRIHEALFDASNKSDNIIEWMHAVLEIIDPIRSELVRTQAALDAARLNASDAEKRLRELVPRDAEIERLRAQVDELAGIRVALFAEVRQALAERDEARVEMARLARCYDAVTARADSTEAERDDYAGRLRDTDAAYTKVTAERDRLRQESGSLFRKLCAALDVNPAGETWASFVTRVGALVGERDEAREEWKRADAERYRLRQELDLIGEQHSSTIAAEVADAVRQRSDMAEELHAVRRQLANAQIAESMIEGIRPRVRELARALGIETSQPGAFERWIAERDTNAPAEPRRWVAGDPEPEPGVTVTTSGWSNGLTWTLRRNGTWHMNNCPTDPEECPTPGTTWGVLLREHGELVEVVSTDG